MSGFTPGPWLTAEWYGPTEGGTSVQSSRDSNLICSCTGYYGRDQARANARLIAAAPELLETLQWLDRVGGLGQKAHERISSAIAKATGEPE